MSRQMKDSGIEWIGEIPETWELGRNKNCFKCSKEIVGESSNDTQLLSLTTKGVRLKSETDTAGKVPESYDTYQIVEVDDIIMCLFDLDVSAVFSGISPYKGMISPAYKILKCNSLTVPKYVDYWFRYIFDGRKFKHFSKNLRYTLNYDEFATLPILIPTVDEQKRIAEYLDQQCAHIDAVIEKTKASIEEYKKLKQAVITQVVTKGVRGDRPMKESGIEWIGEIPADWGLPKLKYISKIGSGATPDRGKKEYWNGDIPWIKTGELQGNIIINSEEYITENGMKNSSVILFPENTILMAMYGQGKTRGMTAKLGINSTTNQACAGIQVSKDGTVVDFVWKFLVGSYDAIREKAQGSGQPNLNIALIEDFYITLPPSDEQLEIVEYLESKCPEIDKLVNKKEVFLAELESYKKSLIYEYVTGKKEVPQSCQ